MPLLIYYDELYMLHPLISALILETSWIIELKGSKDLGQFPIQSAQILTACG